MQSNRNRQYTTGASSAVPLRDGRDARRNTPHELVWALEFSCETCEEGQVCPTRVISESSLQGREKRTATVGQLVSQKTWVGKIGKKETKPPSLGSGWWTTLVMRWQVPHASGRGIAQPASAAGSTPMQSYWRVIDATAEHQSIAIIQAYLVACVLADSSKRT